MGPWCLIGALLLLTATAGDSTKKITSNLYSLSSSSSLSGHTAIQTGGNQNLQSINGGGSGGSASNLNGPNGGGTMMGAAGGGQSSLNVIVEEPEFTEYIENVTVPAGRNVKLGCSVKNLGSYKVAWMHFEQSAILTVHNHVITRNPRISVTQHKHDRHRTWYLHINNVHEEDKGRYMCQINTVTAKTQFGYLNVVVPPNIDDSLSSSDVIVREGTNVSIRCRATGSPSPTVKWKRDDNSKIAINKNHVVTEWEGDTLNISRISRLDMGAYLCIATNGVPPSVSKRIKVSVDFPPMLLIPHQLVGAPEGFNVTLECFTEANPTSLNYWTRGSGPIIHDSTKYRVESTVGIPSYKIHMKLTIYNVNSDDDGTYKCVAKNPRGDTDGTIRLYVSYPPTTQSTGLLTTDSHLDNYGNNNNNNNSPSKAIYNDKNSKHPSNLNDIGLSEQKSSLDKTSTGYGWPVPGEDTTDIDLRNNSPSQHSFGGKLHKFEAFIKISTIYGLLTTLMHFI